MPFTIIDGGSYTSTGAGKKIPIPSSADFFVTENINQINDVQTPGRCIGGEWYGTKFGAGASAQNDGVRITKSDGTNVVEKDLFSTATASDGFTYVTTVPFVEAQAPNAITAITAASPAVVTQTNTYSNGDIVRLYNTTGMLQIAGMPFQISSVSGAGYTLIGLRAAGFAAPATAGFTRRISKFAAVDPETLFITEITKATRAVVRTSVDPTAFYVVGMKIYFSIPQSFGMVELNGLTGTITAVSSANYTVTVDIDTSTFTTFAFPASTDVPTSEFAQYAPAGASTEFDPVNNVETGYNFQYQPFRTAEFTPYMWIAGGAQSPGGSAGDVINYTWYKFET